MSTSFGAVTVNVTGPGGIINFETEMIRKVFADLGMTVEINDPHPFKSDSKSSMTFEQYIERCKKGANARHKVIINVNHLPWGG